MTRGLACVFCASLVVLNVSEAAGQGELTSDELILKAAAVALDDQSLLQFLRRQLPNKVKDEQPEQAMAAARLLAARQVRDAAAVLLDYVAELLEHGKQAATDEAEEEILAALGELTVRSGKIDPLLFNALNARRAGQRAAAVYVLGRRGGLEQREKVRAALADSDPLVRKRAIESLISRQPLLHLKEHAAGDEDLLKSHGVGTEERALLGFLRERTLDEGDQIRLRRWIEELGSPAFVTRSRASKLLIKEGTPALAYLKAALLDPDAEVARRAALCIEELRRGPGSALPAAAVRLLARPAEQDHSPAALIRALLAYAPFADDEAVEEEICTVLAVLSSRAVKVDPCLTDTLGDPLAARRGVAARVLGRVGTEEQRAGLRRLLEDPVALTRFRAVQGLLSAHDQAAVPALIALLNYVPADMTWQVEEMLQRLAGPEAPATMVRAATPETRQLAARAWSKWYAPRAATLDLARVTADDAPLGLMTVCEYDSAAGQPGGQVWEAGRDGRQRWKISGVSGAMDAQVLPNGRVLIAENTANRITERDLTGAVKWEYRTPGTPIACQRLPNGNTFIATYNQVMEITPDQRQLYLQTKGPQFYIFSARKTRDGLIVAMTAQGNILRFDPLTGKDYPSINLGPNGGWCSVEPLANGRYLVATMNNGQVREVDAAGAAHWTITMPGAFRATRLPSGNTLVASMTTRLVAEYDRNGTKRWEKTCEGRPWCVRYR